MVERSLRLGDPGRAVGRRAGRRTEDRAAARGV